VALDHRLAAQLLTGVPAGQVAVVRHTVQLVQEVRVLQVRGMLAAVDQ